MILNGAVLCTPLTTTVIATYTSPNRAPEEVKSIILWGDVDAEYTLLKNNEIVGGGRTSPSNRTIQLFFDQEIGLMYKDIFTVTAYQCDSAPQTIKCAAVIQLL